MIKLGLVLVVIIFGPTIGFVMYKLGEDRRRAAVRRRLQGL